MSENAWKTPEPSLCSFWNAFLAKNSRLPKTETEDGRHRQRDNKQKHFGDYGLASSRTVRIDFANHGELSSKYTSL